MGGVMGTVLTAFMDLEMNKKGQEVRQMEVVFQEHLSR